MSSSGGLTDRLTHNEDRSAHLQCVDKSVLISDTNKTKKTPKTPARKHFSLTKPICPNF